MPTPANPTLVLALLEKHGLPRVEPVRVPHEGVANAVWLCGEVVVRIEKDAEYRSDVFTEVVAVPAAVAAGVLSPRLLVFDPDCDVVDALVTIYERMEGDPAGTLSDRLPPEAAAALGYELAKLHGVSSCPDPHGWLDPFEPDELARALAEAGPHLAPEEQAWVDQVSPPLLEPIPEPPFVFVHRDVHLMNVLAAGDLPRLTALLDYGDAGWGLPEEDFAMLPPWVQAPALRAYREIRETDSWFDVRLKRSTLTAILEDIENESPYPNHPRGLAGLRRLIRSW